ncbi:UDP-glucose dehydrogenase family protein [Paenibacillus albus]|nr:nucleotide sugar dehydrogenase [Paenibacillus albus]
MRVSVVGLGKLGLCTAACFASKGHQVIGVEKNLEYVHALKNKQAPIDEEGLPELLEQAWGNLEITTDINIATLHSDITLIIVPTPSDSDGRFTNRFINAVLEEIAPAIRSKDTYHIINVVSTVMPGSSDQQFIPFIESLTGKQVNEEFGFAYNPEFIALGTVIKNFMNPDMVLIGASDSRTADFIKHLYETTIDNQPHYNVMTLVNAEITKLSLNCYVTMKISFANELASICERVNGADIDVVTQAVGTDSRVGRKYLSGGLGFAGPCFPRDNIAFQAFAEEFGSEARIGKQVVAINHNVVDRIMNIVRERISPRGKVSILGLSYKPGTHIIEESQSIQLAKKLLDSGYKVVLSDPKALPFATKVFGEAVEYKLNPYECVAEAAGVIIMTNWPEFTQLDWNRVSELMLTDAVLMDSWRMLKDKQLKNVQYIALGLGRIEQEKLKTY